jgi:hypothetical protein
MAAYAVVARIDRVKPHLAGHGSAAGEIRPAAEVIDAPVAIELVARPAAPLLAERWAGIRDAWSQTTFYLFNEEGWR